MSRAYRIKVRESLRRVIRAEDRVSTQLEMLEVLPPEQMAELLAEELKRRGFEEKGDALVRKQNGVTVTRRSEERHRDRRGGGVARGRLEGEKDGRAYDDLGPNAQDGAEAAARGAAQDLEKQAEQKGDRAAVAGDRPARSASSATCARSWTRPSTASPPRR